MRGSTPKEQYLQALQEGLEEYLAKVYGPVMTWHPDQKRELSLAFYAGIHWCNQANGLVVEHEQRPTTC